MWKSSRVLEKEQKTNEEKRSLIYLHLEDWPFITRGDMYLGRPSGGAFAASDEKSHPPAPAPRKNELKCGFNEAICLS